MIPSFKTVFFPWVVIACWLTVTLVFKSGAAESISDFKTYSQEIPTGPPINSSAPIAMASFPLVTAPDSLPQVSFVSADPGRVGIEPMQVLPEPGSFSLLVVGLAVMGLVYRFAPRKA